MNQWMSIFILYFLMKNTMTVLPMYMHNQHDRSKLLTSSLWSKLHFFTVFFPLFKNSKSRLTNQNPILFARRNSTEAPLTKNLSSR